MPSTVIPPPPVKMSKKGLEKEIQPLTYIQKKNPLLSNN